ncbi:MAG: hypothetical protein LC777_22365, partial [Actinobacteria bacterium]|nr:hypothetical protein [Actinomycetota bacterium]
MRRVLDGADEALLGVAFVQQRGVNLLERELATLGHGRLVATTVFGATTVQGLETARTRGLGVRVLNPSHGTFIPSSTSPVTATSLRPPSARHISQAGSSQTSRRSPCSAATTRLRRWHG